MKFDQLVNLMFEAWKVGTTETFLILGPPGIGKSSTAAALAAKMNQYMKEKEGGEAVLEVLDLSSKNPEDITGLPYRVQVDGKEETHFAPLGNISRLCAKGAFGVLCLDDLPAAIQGVQVASRQIVLESRVGDAHLSPRILKMVTGNRREDKSAASTLPAHFRNSVIHLELDVNLDSWIAWYGSQGLNPVITSFLLARPAHHSKLPSDADAQGVFATPRTWAKLGRMYSVAQNTNTLFEVAKGLVGEGIGTEFMAFVNTRAQLVPPEEVLANPSFAISDPERVLNTPDKMVAMVSGLSEVTAAKMKDGDMDNKLRWGLLWLSAVAHVTRANREFIGQAIHSFIGSGGQFPVIVQAAANNRNHPGVAPILEFMSKALHDNRK